ncbi:uncharacterized protein LOC141851382 [Brevipalpus obovatus]|uniref:uncharacterized protein LOC141851382 n=1 Tax=Brevipalpus obovatus TaxID=246614 RepID=UPI003D9EB469
MKSSDIRHVTLPVEAFPSSSSSSSTPPTSSSTIDSFSSKHSISPRHSSSSSSPLPFDILSLSHSSFQSMDMPIGHATGCMNTSTRNTSNSSIIPITDREKEQQQKEEHHFGEPKAVTLRLRRVFDDVIRRPIDMNYKNKRASFSIPLASFSSTATSTGTSSTTSEKPGRMLLLFGSSKRKRKNSRSKMENFIPKSGIPNHTIATTATASAISTTPNSNNKISSKHTSSNQHGKQSDKHLSRPVYPTRSIGIHENANIGLFYASKAVFQLLFNPLTPRMIHRFGHDISQMIALVTLFCCSTLFAFGYDYVTFFIARCIHGMASSMISISGKIKLFGYSCDTNSIT